MRVKVCHNLSPIFACMSFREKKEQGFLRKTISVMLFLADIGVFWQTRPHVNELLEAKILEAAAQAQADREALQASLASREAELASLQELLQVRCHSNTHAMISPDLI